MARERERQRGMRVVRGLDMAAGMRSREREKKCDVVVPEERVWRGRSFARAV